MRSQCKRGGDVLVFEVQKVSDDLFAHGPGRKKIEDAFHTNVQTANAQTTIAWPLDERAVVGRQLNVHFNFHCRHC